MNSKKFNFISNIISIVILVIASFTYLSTIEPTTSFWDCGEFIASSYKLEIGHPPGNPVFQLIARLFTIFSSPENAAVSINAMSALCSAFTIFFLYLTIVHFGKRIIERSKEELSLANAISIFGAGTVGALAYCFSDTFWFSAVEAEVYAMSSLFTAIVFWAMLKWEEQAGTPYANRWIALIAFLMGISIGVHLLNLLAIPAIVFIYYYKNYEVTRKRTAQVLAVSGVILAAILYGIIPWVPKLSASIDLLTTNTFGLPMNTGATIFVLALIGAGFWGIYYTYKKKKVLLNTIILCSTLIMVGYSTFAVVVIRSSANTPTNEYQPDNPHTLVRYIGREQYGKNPLLYGETFASPAVEGVYKDYYNTLNGKYVKVEALSEYKYQNGSLMLFPRMWSGASESHAMVYKSYTEGRGKTIPGGEDKIPSFKDNLSFFFDYQVDFMYLRYFMWNFVGRQNDLHSQMPNDYFKGNWESGIGFIDRARLGDQSEGPEYIVDSKSKNHYYFLPLILGLLGLFFQLKRDGKNWNIVMLMFILTGIAIVVYLNQPPLQVRERDYAYAGSFYSFSIWIGLAVMWIANFLKKASKNEMITASAATVLCLVVPFQMASENWDDHDRSNRYTVRDMAYNYLNFLDPNAIIVPHGDNDTFPLWYSQEVEGVRTDVRVMNTSLLGMDWYIDQMQQKMYESEPIKLSIPKSQYFYGVNDHVFINERFNRPMPIKDIIEIFKNPNIKAQLQGGREVNYIAAKQLIVPVNKENVRKYNIVPEEDMHKVQDSIILNISSSLISKTDLIILDMIANYNWDRPIYFLQQAGDINIGVKDYLQYDGFTYKFIPIKNSTGISNLEEVNTDELYERVMNGYKWESLSDTTINIDYQNLLTFNHQNPQRTIFINTAEALFRKGENEKAANVLDKMQEAIPAKNFPLTNTVISSNPKVATLKAIALYIELGQAKKAEKLADELIAETVTGLKLFTKEHKGELLSFEDTQSSLYDIAAVSQIFNDGGLTEIGNKYSDIIDEYVGGLNN